MILSKLSFFLLEIFDIVIIRKSFTSHEINSFLGVSELSNSLNAKLRIFYSEYTVSCDAGSKGQSEKRI